jgi:predicted nucleotide-binding protein (sugar kinase/HSP70/actin superfamily)
VFVSGEPFYLKQAFKEDFTDRKILTPFLNFGNGWDKEESKFIEMGEELGVNSDECSKAYRTSVRMQEDFSKELFSMGKEFVEFLKENPEEMAIVLVGRPYNAFTEFANKGIPRKFASRGVYVIPYDMLNYTHESIDDNQYWESGKKILKVAPIIKNNNQLFATYISNYSCGPDSMLLTSFRSIMGSKPSLTLELDGHTADAGVNTRIDAALDIIRNYRKIYEKIDSRNEVPFFPAKIEFTETSAFFVTSEGEKLNLKDKSIDILIPSMGDLTAGLFAASLKSQGFNAIAMPEGNQDILKYGRANTSGKECLPLILCVGALVDYLENRWDGKQKVAFFIVQGAGNCRLGQYPVYMRELIKRKKLTNVTTLTLMNEDGFAGLGPNFAMRGIQAVLISDVLDDIRSGIMAHSVDPEKGVNIFNEGFSKLCYVMATKPDKIYYELKKFALDIKNRVRSRLPITEAKYIALCGEIYVRRDHFSHKWLNKHFAKHGFILKDAYISEWVFYVDYLLKQKLLEPDTSFTKKLERYIRVYYMRMAEYRIKRILAKTGYYKFSRTKIKPLIDHSKHVIPIEYKGEPGLTLGTALHETIEKYCGVINLGPFGCMPTRFTEAVSLPEMKIENKIEAGRLINPKYDLPEIFNRKMNLPFLTIETDGNVFPQLIEARLETFILQAEKVAKLMKEARMNGYL